ncbi:exosortase A [Candidatus Accumulibacter sp. ACC003]|uniref:exosortase A n=1 Tax=Candidatus Accumulibacter sp. ACC003 TaxID=2823334 RepID=UPI0025BBA9F4|nr:exosortase A [Candidatus Accumulibacter sp. ACC003]
MKPSEASLTSFSAHPGWRVALPAIVLTELIVVLLFRDTALAMASIWQRSDTYAHGFIVPPITLWLIWRIRSSLAVLPPRHSYSAVFLFAGVGFAWLLGELAAVNVVAQFALVAMLILAVPAVLGWQLARRITFPLLFLFFAVPFGDFALPTLMDWTAHFTVLGLRLSGIPVHSEGLRFVIPTGSWSVVEACSGVRYLIASVTVGTLFAYLSYRSLTRRLVFVAVSFLVPIVANWVRAYMIVMLGHLSGNTLAVGVDHLIYGWVFFGVVIVTMFWVGARWREDELEPLAPVVAPGTATAAVTAPSLIAAAFTVLVGGGWSAALWQIEHQLAPPIAQFAALEPIAGWSAIAAADDEWQPKYENYAAKTQAIFAKDGSAVGLFVAYYRNQDQHSKMVSSSNVLVTSQDHTWARVGGGTREIAFNQQPLKVRTTRFRASGNREMLVWQWYWVDGRWTASDALAKAYTAWARLSGKGDDSAVLVVYAQSDRLADGEAALAAFSAAAGPAIETALRQTMGAR